MALEVMSKFAFYASHVIKGLFEIAIGKEEYIYDDKGNILSKLPSKRRQVLVFARNFLKEPVSFFSWFKLEQKKVTWVANKIWNIWSEKKMQTKFLVWT